MFIEHVFTVVWRIFVSPCGQKQ